MRQDHAPLLRTVTHATALATIGRFVTLPPRKTRQCLVPKRFALTFCYPQVPPLYDTDWNELEDASPFMLSLLLLSDDNIGVTGGKHGRFLRYFVF